MYWKGKRIQSQDRNKVTMSVDGEFWANVPLYLNEVNHSPDGFEWGYRGSGPAQLAYAILRTHFDIVGECLPEISKMFAARYYHDFKDEFVLHWKGDEWELSSDEIELWLAGKKAGWIGEDTITSGCPVILE
jgi:hypothetical protein